MLFSCHVELSKQQQTLTIQIPIMGQLEYHITDSKKAFGTLPTFVNSKPLTLENCYFQVDIFTVSVLFLPSSVKHSQFSDQYFH